LTVLYGSNAGSSEAFAQRIANDARQRGYTSTLGTLDSAAGHLATEGAVVIVTSSYEGLPPDNARTFVSWAEGLTDQALSGVRYAVFGCGNADWARTYQAVPKAIDARLAAAGARRLVDRGEANARGDFFGDFETWYDQFWIRVGAEFGQTDATVTGPLLEVSLRGATRDPLLRQNNLALGTIVANRELVNMSAPKARSKRHLEIALPAGTRYTAGDYLAVLPLNPAAVVDRALARFDLAYDAQAVISMGAGGRTFLPTDQPVTVGELLSSYVELSQPASRRQIEQLAATTQPADKDALQSLVVDDGAYQAEILDKRISVLDLLERYPTLEVPLASFLQMLTPLVPRQYSISSSPRWSDDHVTLTVAVLSAPARSGNGTYEGVASTYLAHARPGTKVAITVRLSSSGFHPPDSLAVPMVMVCAGTGVAPFRGFLQERALRAQEEGAVSAPSLLFFGCDHPDVDYIYREEFAQWEELGLVSVRPAFSDMNGDSQFVQERLWADRADVVDRIRSGGVFYVCGDGRRVAPAVHETCARIYQEAAGATAEEADTWLTEVQRQRTRYVTDVFA
jgi:cytochrome P450/NADPH-cytochrome P450 reductase